MEIQSLSTDTFCLSGSQYMSAWAGYNIRRHAWSYVAAIALLIVIGVADIRFAIASAMLLAVILPMAALLAWSRIMDDAALINVTTTQSIIVADGIVRATDADGLPLYNGKLTGARTTSSFLMLQVKDLKAPIAVPARSVIKLKLKPRQPDTFS